MSRRQVGHVFFALSHVQSRHVALSILPQGVGRLASATIEAINAAEDWPRSKSFMGRRRLMAAPLLLFALALALCSTLAAHAAEWQTASSFSLQPSLSRSTRASSDSADAYWWHGFSLPYLDGPVLALAVFRGDLVAAGDFEVAGGRVVNHIARPTRSTPTAAVFRSNASPRSLCIGTGWSQAAKLASRVVSA